MNYCGFDIKKKGGNPQNNFVAHHSQIPALFLNCPLSSLGVYLKSVHSVLLNFFLRTFPVLFQLIFRLTSENSTENYSNKKYAKQWFNNEQTLAKLR